MARSRGHERQTSTCKGGSADVCKFQSCTRSGRRPARRRRPHTQAPMLEEVAKATRTHTHRGRWRKPQTHTQTHTHSVPYQLHYRVGLYTCLDTRAIRRVTFMTFRNNCVTHLHAAAQSFANSSLHAACNFVCRALRSGALDPADHDEAAPRWRSAGCAVWLGLVPEAWHHPLSSSTPARPPCSSFCSQSASLQPSEH